MFYEKLFISKYTIIKKTQSNYGIYNLVIIKGIS